MNINRNNYEELYLLYVDGELSAQERKAVEQFMEENPDTVHELMMLQQTKLDAEKIVFADKSSLYKTASNELNQQNYEEQFLLYVDDELNDEEKKKTELFVLQHPQLQQEFSLLKQTKLVSENIIFPNKSSLYKKERKPVIYFSWTRLAIAAALIGMIFLAWTIMPVKNTGTQEIVTIKKDITKPIERSNNISNNAIIANSKNAEKKITIDLKQINREERNIIPVKNNIETKGPVFESKDENIIVAETEPIKHSINKNDIVASIDRTPEIRNTIAAVEDKSLVQQTIYKELDTQDDDRRNNIYIGNMEVNKDKLVGFFKRASHVFSKSKDDDGNVAIANFSIKSKSLK